VGNLAQLDLRNRADEALLRALIEDLVEQYKGYYPGQHLVLATWFGKSPGSQVQDVLLLYSEPWGQGVSVHKFAVSDPISLMWKNGTNAPPFVRLHVTSVEYFDHLLTHERSAVNHYLEGADVVLFVRQGLTPTLLKEFRIQTEPAGLIKGWYIDTDAFKKTSTIQGLLGLRAHARPEVGFLKTEESPDFRTRRGLIHVEVSQRWLPLSPSGIQAYSYYTDWRRGHPGFFLFELGSLYKIINFEIKTAPEYSSRVLEASRDDRYPEVSLQGPPPFPES
jgi:hypothetical protein